MTQSAQLRVIPDSETFSATTKYLGQKKVQAVFSLRRDAKSPRYGKEALFDFSRLTEEELLTMAMYSAKVKLQAILRNLSPEVMLNSETLAKIDVKADLLEADKAPADPVTAAVRSIMKATGVTKRPQKHFLEQAKSKAEKAKGAGPIKTLLKAAS